MGAEHRSYILVTGANSGLGFAICCRLADEFLAKHPSSRSLTVIFTTRSAEKGSETLSRLSKHLRKSNGAEKAQRITFQPENVDLTRLLSVRALAQKLNAELPRLDAVILNAGIGGFTGINWPRAIWTILTDMVQAATWPTYKLSSIGATTRPQCAAANGDDGAKNRPAEPPLAEVFCANVFGHYMLSHYLLPVLSAGKIIWISSIEPDATVFDSNDVQGFRSPKAYETSKRLTDLICLTSSLPSTRKSVSSFLTPSSSSSPSSASPSASSPSEPTQPQTYVAHPGICGTSIVPLAYILQLCMFSAFYFARWLGSPWHTVTPYLGAAAPVWLALSSKEEIHSASTSPSQMVCTNTTAAAEATTDASSKSAPGGSLIKWGSATTFTGKSIILKTEVPGWGYTGAVDETIERKGRKRGAIPPTQESRETFEEQGRGAWQDLESLRTTWEQLLDH